MEGPDTIVLSPFDYECSGERHHSSGTVSIPLVDVDLSETEDEGGSLGCPGGSGLTGGPGLSSLLESPVPTPL